MNRELMRKAGEVGVSVASLWVIWQLINSAFSRDVRRQILERDGYRCVSCGETQNLQAAHKDHRKNQPGYDKKETGETKCARCHYLSHFHQEDVNITWHHHLSACNLAWSDLPAEVKITLPSPDMFEPIHRPHKEKPMKQMTLFPLPAEARA